MIDSGYLETMRVPLIAGRLVTDEDDAERESVVIVNQVMSGRLWLGRDPIDQTIVTGGREYRVVGVVGDVRHSSLEDGAGLEMYMPIGQAG